MGYSVTSMHRSESASESMVSISKQNALKSTSVSHNMYGANVTYKTSMEYNPSGLNLNDSGLKWRGWVEDKQDTSKFSTQQPLAKNTRAVSYKNFINRKGKREKVIRDQELGRVTVYGPNTNNGSYEVSLNIPCISGNEPDSLNNSIYSIKQVSTTKCPNSLLQSMSKFNSPSSKPKASHARKTQQAHNKMLKTSITNKSV